MNIALILAGGSGSRMGDKLPKQFLRLGGESILHRAVSVFVMHPEIDRIMVVCHPDWIDVCKEELIKLPKRIEVIAGGTTRQDSSYYGLCELEKDCDSDSLVLIHDAARPLVSPRIITDNLTCAKEFHACTTAVQTQDTILMSDGGDNVLSIPGRDRMYAVQTPQTFHLSLILQGHRELDPHMAVTDDAGILLQQNIPVKIVSGDKRNLKITSAEDFAIAETFLCNMP